ncbi:hypothetical protein [Burkholderia catarinensis]|nr:hypothetical protein [Burkholderia catarinensis]
MQHTIEQASDLGGATRVARKVQKWRQNHAAGRAAGQASRAAGNGTAHD